MPWVGFWRNELISMEERGPIKRPAGRRHWRLEPTRSHLPLPVAAADEPVSVVRAGCYMSAPVVYTRARATAAGRKPALLQVGFVWTVPFRGYRTVYAVASRWRARAVHRAWWRKQSHFQWFLTLVLRFRLRLFLHSRLYSVSASQSMSSPSFFLLSVLVVSLVFILSIMSSSSSLYFLLCRHPRLYTLYCVFTLVILLSILVYHLYSLHSYLHPRLYTLYLVFTIIFILFILLFALVIIFVFVFIFVFFIAIIFVFVFILVFVFVSVSAFIRVFDSSLSSSTISFADSILVFIFVLILAFISAFCLYSGLHRRICLYSGLYWRICLYSGLHWLICLYFGLYRHLCFQPLCLMFFFTVFILVIVLVLLLIVVCILILIERQNTEILWQDQFVWCGEPLRPQMTHCFIYLIRFIYVADWLTKYLTGALAACWRASVLFRVCECGLHVGLFVCYKTGISSFRHSLINSNTLCKWALTLTFW